MLAVTAQEADRTAPVPRLVSHVLPSYPQTALMAQVQGEVVLEATVGADGTVEDARVLRSVPLLDQAALDAVRQWQFKVDSVRAERIPVPVRTVFSLERSPRSSSFTTAPPSWLPFEFAVRYTYTCNAGVVEIDTAARAVSLSAPTRDVASEQVARFRFDVEDAAELFVDLVGTGFFTPELMASVWTAGEVAPGLHADDQGVTVGVVATPPLSLVRSTAPFARFSNELAVRRGREWRAVYWDDPLPGESSSDLRGIAARAVRLRQAVGDRLEGASVPRRELCL